jgi:type I restriction enzyme S subunit
VISAITSFIRDISLTLTLYGTSDKADYSETGWPVLRIGNIGFCEFVLDDIKRVELTDKESAKCLLQEGDLLIVRSNGNPDLVGKCAVWPGSQEQFVYAFYLIRFRFKSDLILPRYVMFYLMSEHGRSLLSPQQGGGTYNISATGFQSVKLAVPPLEDQATLVARLDEELATVKRVEKMAQAAQERMAILLKRLWED